MAGGQRIDDHSSWIGKAQKGEVFPSGNKVKFYHSKDGVGSVDMYGDTNEAIQHQQEEGEKKAKSHAQKPGYRN